VLVLPSNKEEEVEEGDEEEDEKEDYYANGNYSVIENWFSCFGIEAGHLPRLAIVGEHKLNWQLFLLLLMLHVPWAYSSGHDSLQGILEGLF
jgi:hypothetical protein